MVFRLDSKGTKVYLLARSTRFTLMRLLEKRTEVENEIMILKIYNTDLPDDAADN